MNWFWDLVVNLTLLSLLAVVIEVLPYEFKTPKQTVRRIGAGIFIGLMGMVLISYTWVISEGVMYDTRPILLSLTGLFLGPLPTITASAAVSLFRIYQGGIGTVAGVALSLSSGALGLYWWTRRKDSLHTISPLELYFFGIAVTAVSLSAVFILPLDRALHAFQIIALPVIITYPLITALLGMLLVHRVQRERASRELAASKEKYQVLVESAEAVVWEYSIPDDRWTYVSPQTSRIFGYGPHDWVDRDFWLSRIHPDERERVGYFCNEKASRGENYLVEYRFRTNGDGYVWLRDIVDVEMEGGRPVLLRGIMFDISDRKEAERQRQKLQEQLYQVQKMESVGRLAGGIAHDFNNMIGVIHGYAELLNDLVIPGSREHDYIRDIMTASQRSADLTRQLLAYARKQETDPAAVNLNDIIEEMLSMLTRLLGDNIRLDFLPTVNLRLISMDLSQFSQVITNVLVNSRDALSGKGVITMFTANIKVPHAGAELPPGEYVELRITDNGTGMTEEVKTHMFDPFYTTKEIGSGTGMGMSIVMGIVQQHHGEIFVESAAGEGTTVRMVFPADDSSVPESGNAATLLYTQE